MKQILKKLNHKSLKHIHYITFLTSTGILSLGITSLNDYILMASIITTSTILVGFFISSSIMNRVKSFQQLSKTR